MVAVLFGACGPSSDPSQAFDAFALALEQGDRDAAMGHLTRASRAAFEALDAADGQGSARRLALGGEAGIRPTRAVSVVASPAPDLALIAVQAQGPAGQNERGEIIMTLEDGAWRVDLVRTEQVLWSRDWARSGSEGQPPPSWLDLPVDGLPPVE